MDGITPDNIKLNRLAPSNCNVHSHSSKSENLASPNHGLGSTISVHSELVEKSKASQPDIRPEFVARAQSLINDPNWLGDHNLNNLANKIIQEEI